MQAVLGSGPLLRTRPLLLRPSRVPRVPVVTPIRHLAAVPDVPVTRSTAWAEREDDTWIDRM